MLTLQIHLSNVENQVPVQFRLFLSNTDFDVSLSGNIVKQNCRIYTHLLVPPLLLGYLQSPSEYYKLCTPLNVW